MPVRNGGKLIAGIVVLVFFLVAFVIRAVLPYDQVFVGDWVKFTSADSYYYMRLIDNTARNFPHINLFDPYFIYPGGGSLNTFQFFTWLVAGTAWVLGLGSPSQHLVDIVGVYAPAVLGALSVVPVFFIGALLFNRWVGLLAAAAISVLAGEFLGRSILGFTDVHVAESLFSTVAMLFLILAIKETRRRELTFTDIREINRKKITRPLLYSLLAGVSLGVYLITWGGGLMFAFLIVLYFIVQFIIDHVKNQSTDYLCITGVLVFFIALVIFVPIRAPLIYQVSLITGLLIPVVLNLISRMLNRRKIRPGYYPLALVGIGVVGLAAFYLIDAELLQVMLDQFGIFAPAGAMATTTMEMQPLLRPDGAQWSLTAVWGNFTTDFYISLISMVLLTVFVVLQIKKGKIDHGIILFLIWSVVIMAAALGQRRFSYYFAINVAVFTGYFSWLFLSLAAMVTDWLFGRIRTVDLKTRLSWLSGVPTEAGEVKPHRDAIYREDIYVFKYVFMALAGIIVFWFAYSYNIPHALSVASGARFAPSNAWCSAMDWMRTNTPEPFADADYYYANYPEIPEGVGYKDPASAYGVASWWDYGYWISRMAHRLPDANPGQSPEPIRDVADLLLSRDKSPSPELIAKLKPYYTVIDYATATSKFWAIITWAGRSQDEFYEVYYLPREGKLLPVLLYYPAYYQTICSRLYNFDNKDVTRVGSIVVTYEMKTGTDGKPTKQITDALEFTDYQAAQDFIKNQKSGNHVLIGADPFISPVPLESMKDYNLVFSSQQGVSIQDAGSIPEVKIFEYTGK